MPNQKETKTFIEDLEETILRLHIQLRAWEEEHDQFKKRPFLKEDKKKFDDILRKYIYYQGKFYAYYYTLEKLGSDVPGILKRLRGIEMPNSSQIIETKAHYTEIYGHFPTNQALKKK